MTNTLSYLVDKFQATVGYTTVGYTQSDELTLMWYVDSASLSEYPFDGRLQLQVSNAWLSKLREPVAFLFDGIEELYHEEVNSRSL